MFQTNQKMTQWQRIVLILILVLAAFLNFYNIDQESYANLYYAAGVYSMGQNLHAFFFNSFDSIGFVTIDKPPLGLWLQVLSTKLFGFHGWALILPQALAGVLSVGLIYFLVRRIFGVNAGLLAGLILAVTPISVAASRNNTMDGVLVLTLLLAVWAVTLAAERGQLRWLLLSGLLVGLGFEIKMLQAYMILPAIYLVYFFTAKTSWIRRIWHLVLVTGVITVISFTWPLAVDLIPAGDRPYIGSSDNNTVVELIVGHNGASRMGEMAALIGLDVGGPPGARPNLDDGANNRNNLAGPPPVGQNLTVRPSVGINPSDGNQPRPQGNLPQDNQTPLNQNPNQQAGIQPGMGNETGVASATRLFNQQLAGQITWFLPLALLFIVFLPFTHRLIRDYPIPGDSIIRFTLLWGAWLIPQTIFFSYAGLFHRYYLMMLAPAIAALMAAGIKVLWNLYQLGGWRRMPFVLAVLIALATQINILTAFPDFAIWLLPILLLAVGAYLSLVFLTQGQKRIVHLGLAVLLLAPLVWALIPVFYGGHSGLPYAGPDLIADRSRNSEADDRLNQSSALAEYLLAHQGETPYLAAAPSSMLASPLIILTGQPVLALGGFSGGDQIISQDDLQIMVASGLVRYFLVESAPGQNQQIVNQRPGNQNPGVNNQAQSNTPANPTRPGLLQQWVIQNCAPVEGYPIFDCAVDF